MSDRCATSPHPDGGRCSINVSATMSTDDIRALCCANDRRWWLTQQGGRISSVLGCGAGVGVGAGAGADREGDADPDSGHRRHQHAEHQQLLPPASITRIDRFAPTSRFRQCADALGHAALEIEIHVLFGDVRRHRRHGRRTEPDRQRNRRHQRPNSPRPTRHSAIVT